MALASSSGRPMVKMSSRLLVLLCSRVSRKIAVGAWVTIPTTAMAASMARLTCCGRTTTPRSRSHATAK
jgi:hypothetical protein